MYNKVSSSTLTITIISLLSVSAIMQQVTLAQVIGGYYYHQPTNVAVTLSSQNLTSPTLSNQGSPETVIVKTQIKPNPNDYFWRYAIPDNTLFSFSPGSKICPTNNCAQQFQDGRLAVVSPTPRIQLYGVLKIEDKNATTTSDQNIKNWRILITRAVFDITNIREDIAKNKTIDFFEGSLDIGREGSIPQFRYQVTNGTLELPSGMMSFKGASIPTDLRAP